MSRIRIFAFALMMAAGALAISASAAAKPQAANVQAGQSPSMQAAATDAAMMLEGEKRYRTNCGRCHQPPHKYAPRVMATAVRHMRVRAMLTDDDMKYIVYYMTH